MKMQHFPQRQNWIVSHKLETGLMIAAVIAVIGVGALYLLRPPPTAAPAAKQPAVVLPGLEGVNVSTRPDGLTGATTIPVPVTTNPALGIDAPAGVNLSTLPIGLTDYIHPSTVTAPSQLTIPIDPRWQLAPRRINPSLGIDAPAGVNLSTLPTGLTDYIRER